MRTHAWLLWLLPLLFQSADAYAWGLATHVYFSQLLIWAVPLIDPRLRRAARRLPQLVLAGACLPDLALMGRSAQTDAFADTHQWERAARLLADADDDVARAITLGFVSHLFVDIIAHNHFVPAHERMWIRLPMLTHAMSEWAMDAHIAGHLFARPHQLMREHHAVLSGYAAAGFGCTVETASRALRHLQHATGVLYDSRLHALLHLGMRALDGALRHRFDYYVAETAARLPQINRLLVGEQPDWRADTPCPRQVADLRQIRREQLRLSVPLPASLFA